MEKDVHIQTQSTQRKMYYHLPLVKCNTANFGIQPTPSKYRADTKKDTDTSLTYKGSLSDH